MAEIPKLRQVTHAADRRHEYTHFDRIHLERDLTGMLNPKGGKSDLPGPPGSGTQLGPRGKRILPNPPYRFSFGQLVHFVSLNLPLGIFFEKTTFLLGPFAASGRPRSYLRP